jgi:purine-nucleoside phosphorylase
MASIPGVTGGKLYRVAVVLGSGLSDLAGSLVGRQRIPYSDIKALPQPRVAGHEGALYAGEVEGVPALVFAGRAHLYEGHDPATTTRWVDLAVDAGCSTVVITNAAGGINPELEVGAPSLISDHINLTGTNPLVGPGDPNGDRFLDMTDVYDPELRALARSVDPELKEGIYAGLLGPTYETPAEVRMLAALGADLVGMSTVLEAIRARYLGARVLGISVVTNRAAGLSEIPLRHEEVAEAGRRAAKRLMKLLAGVIARLR